MRRAEWTRWLRDLHGISALALAGLIGMYVLTGAAINYQDLLPDEPRRGTEAIEFAFEPAELSDARIGALSQRARRELGLRGRRSAVQRDAAGRVELGFGKPGTRQTLLLDPATGRAELRWRKRGFAGTLGALHQLSGYRGPWPYRVWAALVDATAVAMLLFAASGVALWWLTGRDRLGWALLLGSSFYTVGSVIFLLLRR